MNVFPSFGLDFIKGLKWEEFYYWHRRAQEIFYSNVQRNIKYIEEIQDSKVDDDTFEMQQKRLYAKIERYEKSMEGTINVG